MKSIIICEGGTDLLLIQYFMEETNNWIHIREQDYKFYDEIKQNRIRLKNKQRIKWFKKGRDFLAIYSAGGCSRINKVLSSIIDMNKMMQVSDIPFDKIVIVTDRDEVETVTDFEEEINDVINTNCVEKEVLQNNVWVNCIHKTIYDDEKIVEILLLVIPFEDTGALETFLLEALKQKDITEEKVINQCISFVENIDTDNKFLCRRRERTKAKFDVYFSIRTPMEQFEERRSILKSIKWQDYELVQETFKKLGQL